MKPTEEQIQIKEAFKRNRVLKVNAVAGSGKSTTLKMLAEENKQHSLYICFGKAIAAEAREKFPDHVECRTTHSLAFANHGKPIMHKLNRPKNPKLNVAGRPNEIAKFYSIEAFTCNDPNEPVQPNTVASFVKDTVNRYEQSADFVLDKKHVPYSQIKKLEKTHEGLNARSLTDVVLKYAKRLWKDRCDPSSCVLAFHDTYLKLWQLSKPKLNYDIIYLDECQDSAPTVLDIVSRQTHCKVAYVGDTYQSIYQFRGAVNAMDAIEAPTYTLSKSFRYGKDVADVAKWIINSAIDVKGLETINSKVCSVANVEKKFTHIFRTNGSLLETAVKYLEQGKSVYCEVNTTNFIYKLKSAQALKDRKFKYVNHEDITPYSSWADLLEDCDEDPELKRIARIVSSRETEKFIKNLEKLKANKGVADILLTTAHKSKGAEWDNVVIANDFPLPLDDWEESPFEKMGQPEINLFYVAATRAIKKLELPDVISECDYV